MTGLHHRRERWFAQVGDPNHIGIADRPGNINIVITSSAGIHSLFVPTAFSYRPVTRRIAAKSSRGIRLKIKGQAVCQEAASRADRQACGTRPPPTTLPAQGTGRSTHVERIAPPGTVPPLSSAAPAVRSKTDLTETGGLFGRNCRARRHCPAAASRRAYRLPASTCSAFLPSP